MSSQNIRPLGDRVAIRLLTDEEKGTTSPSGIILPETVGKDAPQEGKVIAVGEGRYENGARVPMQVKVGDCVLFTQYGFDEVKVGGEKYYIGSESSLLAVMSE